MGRGADRSAGGGLLVGLLGPVEVRSTGGQLAGIAQPMLRMLVAMLAIAPGRVVPDEALVDALWGEEWSRDREKNLHTHVSALRRLLAAAEPDRDGSRLVRSGGGYRFELSADEVDSSLFGTLTARGREAARSGNTAVAAVAFADALGLWRGPALADVAGICPRLVGDAANLEHLRVAVLEDRVECDLALGRHGDVAAEGPGLAAQFPLRERLAGQLMVALWRCGRRAEALVAFSRARDTLVEELGMDPGPELRALHAKVLADDPSLAAPAPPPAASQAVTTTAARTRAGTGAGSAASTANGLASSLAVPRQLPAGVGHFAGRDLELKLLDELLDAPPRPGAAAIVAAARGMAGVGKTALAVQWARTVADRFPDGQLYVNLRGFDPDGTPATAEEVTGWFLTALGVPGPAIPTEAQARAGLYRSILADRKVLLLLDNARDAAQVRPLLAGGPGCLALVTSRSSMAGLAASDGARLIPLGQLDDQEATKLLAARLGRERVDKEPDAVADLVRRCAGLPLALAITAARATESPGLPLAALAAELQAESGRLDALDASDQATSIRSVFSWSLRHVSKPATRMFGLLGVHCGPDISLQAAASLAALPVGNARSLLAELAGASLLAEQRPGRYVLHDLLRAYAVERAATDMTGGEIRSAIGRSLSHYLHTMADAEGFGPIRSRVVSRPASGVTAERLADHQELLAWLAAEHRVLLQAMRQAADENFAAELWQLFIFFATSVEWQGRWADWEEPSLAAISAAARADDWIGLGWIHHAVGFLRSVLGATGESIREGQQALRYFQRAGDLPAQARAHARLSNQYTFSEDNAAVSHMTRERSRIGLDHAERALALYREAGIPRGEATALGLLATHHAGLGNGSLARDYGYQALELSRDISDPEAEAIAWDALAWAYRATGETGQAIDCKRQELRLLSAAGPVSGGLAGALTELGDMHQEAGNMADARQAWMEALEIFSRLNHPFADQLRARLETPPSQ